MLQQVSLKIMMERGGMMVFNKLFGKFKKAEVEDEEEIKVQDYLDMIAPSTIRFYTEYFICGNSYRSVWALREYPTSTDEQALLRYMGEKDGVTLHIYARQVTSFNNKDSSKENKEKTFPNGNIFFFFLSFTIFCHDK